MLKIFCGLGMGILAIGAGNVPISDAGYPWMFLFVAGSLGGGMFLILDGLGVLR